MSNDLLSNYLLALADESFFSLYRNYLGSVPTPYNKQELVGRLIRFFRKKETQKRVIAFLDELDRMVIAAVDLLGGPEDEQLGRFIEGSVALPVVRERVMNLKDRMILIHRSRGHSLVVNPDLRDALLEAGVGPATLVRGLPIPDSAPEPTPPWLTLDLLCAVRTYLFQTDGVFTKGGDIRRRSAADLQERFPHVFQDSAGIERFRQVIQILKNLDLIYETEGSVVPSIDAWAELGELPQGWVQRLVWAAALAPGISRAAQISEWLLRLFSDEILDRAFSKDEISILLLLAAGDVDETVPAEAISVLRQIGLLIRLDDDAFRVNPLAARIIRGDDGGESRADVDSAKPTERPLVVHANLEVTPDPNIGFLASVRLSEVAEILRYDVVPTYELTDRSVARGRTLRPEESVLEFLKDHGSAIPQNVLFQVKRWEERATAVHLRTALVLTVSEPEAELLRDIGAFTDLDPQEPAPGVFIVERHHETTLRRVLDRVELAPLETSSTLTAEEPDPQFAGYYARSVQPLLGNDKLAPLVTAWHQERSEDGNGDEQPPSDDASSAPAATDSAATRAGEINRELEDHLKSGTYPEDLQRELEVRIRRRLILFPEQLDGEIAPARITEARGLDYLGKIRLIERSIETGDLVEVVTRNVSGKPERYLVRPQEVRTMGSDVAMVGIDQGRAQVIRLRVRKMSLVRRLSGTLIRASQLRTDR